MRATPTILLVCCLCGALGPRAYSATFTVTTTVDEDDGTIDPGMGEGTSLREAINAANAGADDDTIEFEASLAGAVLEITMFDDGVDVGEFGPTALLASTRFSIVAPAEGANMRIRRTGGSEFRLLHVTPTGNLSMERVNLEEGLARGGTGADGKGGGIYNEGEVTLVACTVSGNAAVGGDGGSGGGDGLGGGIYSEGRLTVSFCALTGNTATGGGSDGGDGGGDGLGGAVCNWTDSPTSGGTVFLTNCTLSGNLAQGGDSSIGGAGSGLGAGLLTRNGDASVYSCTVADNRVAAGQAGGPAGTAGGAIYNLSQGSNAFLFCVNSIVWGTVGGTDFVGTETVAGQNRTDGLGNLFGSHAGFNGQTPLNVDPLLGGLDDNGGPTLTHALMAGSPAIDAGVLGFNPGFYDQRGAPFMRTIDGDGNGAARLDIGSYEYQLLDFGDAPAEYPSSGASHHIVEGLSIGELIDAETNAFSSPLADGDDLDAIDDEDGVGSPVVIDIGSTPTIEVTVVNTTGEPAVLSCWIDYDNNAQFETAERSMVDVPSGAAPQMVTLSLAPLPESFIRFPFMRLRLSTDGAGVLDPAGSLEDGEVEDTLVELVGEIPVDHPEVAVFGNGIEIADGDTTPSPEDHTHFGGATAGEAMVATEFTIDNTAGQGELELTGEPNVQIAGAEALSYTLAQAPPSLIPAGGSSTFVVVFDPETTGTHRASIVIPNNDPDEGEYMFAIEGEGIAGAAGGPEIEVRGENFVIRDGDLRPLLLSGTDFGSVDGFTSKTNTFSIHNVGDAVLQLTANPPVRLEGLESTLFSVSQPAGVALDPGTSVTISVTYGPDRLGVHEGMVVIPNNDSDEGSHAFSIRGESERFAGALGSLLNYLLGVTSDPAGLDFNEDEQVDISDLVHRTLTVQE